jgi:hypothetical protein
VFGSRIQRTVEVADALSGLEYPAQALSTAWRSVNDTIEVLRGCEGQLAFENATPFLWAFGHVVMAWLWLDQAVAATELARSSPARRDFVEGKLRASRFFFECELPKVDSFLTIVASRSDVVSGVSPRIF